MNGNSKLTSQRTAQLAQAVTVGRFTRYEDAQAAVDLLIQRDFPVRNLTIVGAGLRQVEHVVAPLSYARAAGSGAVQGLFYGVLLALLMLVFTGEQWWVALFTALPVAVAFWMIFAVIAYARRGQHRNFAAVGQLVADQYELRCAPQEAQEARRLLSGQASDSPLRPQLQQNPGHPLQDPGGGQSRARAGVGEELKENSSAGGAAAAGEAATGQGAQQPAEQDSKQPSQGQQPPERSRVEDFQDLPDGRPRYGLREGEEG